MEKDTESALKWVVNILKKHNIPFQIGGGFAARMYGVNRKLADIDIAVPTDKLGEILLEVKDYITEDLRRYLDDKWDCTGMTIIYKGQEVDFVGAQGKKIFDEINKKWVILENDFSSSEYKEIYGLTIPIMSKEKLIAYKSILKRDVDLLDLEGLKNNMKKVVIAGSASLIDKSEFWKKFWEEKGYIVTNYPKSIPKETFMEEYSNVHRDFFKDITETDTLFIMNEDKNGIEGYIGAEVFAELCFGVVQNLIYSKNIEILLAKMPSEKVQSYEEIELWLRLGWIKILNK